MFRRDASRQIRPGHRVARKWGGFDGERLGRRCLLARNGTLRHRAIFEAEDRTTGDPVEDEQQAHLVDLRDGGNTLAVLHDVKQRRRSAEIVVPDIVTDQLLVPAQRAGRRVNGDQRRAVRVVARPLHTNGVAGGKRIRRVEDASLRIVPRLQDASQVILPASSYKSFRLS